MIVLLLSASYFVPLFLFTSVRFYWLTRYPEGRWKGWEKRIDGSVNAAPYELQYMFWPIAIVGWLGYLLVRGMIFILSFPMNSLSDVIIRYIEFLERRALRDRDQKSLPKAKIEK